MDKLIYFAPRIIGIAGILFISIFALDAFEAGKPWLDVLINFSMHLIPSAILILAMIFAWRFELVGGLLFVVIGLAPIFLMRGSILNYLIVGGPIALTGMLFLLSYWWHARGRN